MKLKNYCTSLLLFGTYINNATSLSVSTKLHSYKIAAPTSSVNQRQNVLYSSMDEDSPSDYDPSELVDEGITLTVDENEEDAEIRDALKRELLLLATVTNRGECASNEERDIIVDLVTQLEALNPTPDPASCCQGEWDLVLSSTQFFRSSPFFMAIRSALGVNSKDVANTGFDIHDRATSAGRVGRVRQIVTEDELISEVDLSVGMMPGFPVVLKGTVITTASIDKVSSETWDLRVQNTKVKRSNIPLLNQFIDDLPYDFPVGMIYDRVTGSTPVAPLKTFYIDEGIRITRDIDDNFFVYARA